MLNTTNAVLEFVPKDQQTEYDALRRERDRYKAQYERVLRKNAHWHHLYVNAIGAYLDRELENTRRRERRLRNALAIGAFIAGLLIIGMIQ